MAAPIRFLSGRQQQQKIGIEGSTEDKKVLEVVGRTGIGTTSFEPAKILDVRGDAIVEGTTTVGKLEITGTGDVPASLTVETANVTGVSTFGGAVDVNAGLDVDGQADLDEVVVAGVATFSNAVDINSTLDVDGDTQLDDLTVAGVATFSSAINATDIIKGYEYTAAPFGSTVTLAVTVASKDSTHRYNGTGSGNGYVIDGIQAPFLTLTPGRTYRFTNDNTGSHPLKFYLEADKTTLYETNVDFQDTYTEITVTDETPTVLHYQCTAHQYMGNAVQTNANVVNTNYPATIRSTLDVTGVSTFPQLDVSTGGLDVDGLTNLDEVVVTGVSTFTGNIVAVSAEFSGNVTIAGTLTAEDKTNIDSLGIVTARTGVRVDAGGLIVTAGVSTFTDSVDIDNGVGIVGGLTADSLTISGVTTGINAAGISSFVRIDVDGQADLDEVVVAGAATFSGSVNFDVNSEVNIGTGVTILGNNLHVTGIVSATQFIGDGSGITNLPGISTLGSSNLTDVNVSGTTTTAQLRVSGIGTAEKFFVSTGGLEVDGQTDLDELVVAGVSTFNANTNVVGDLSVTGDIGASGIITATGINLVAGSGLDVGAIGVLTALSVDVNTGGIDVDGQATLDEVVVAGVSTFSALVDVNNRLDVVGGANIDQVNVTGIASFKQLDVSTGGIDVDGQATLDEVVVAGVSTFNNDATFVGDSANIFFDKSQNRLEFADTAAAIFGTNDDLQIYHNSHSYIDQTGSNNLHIRNTVDDQDVTIQTDDGSGGAAIYFQAEGASGEASLHHYGIRRIRTIAEGIDVTGRTETDLLNVTGIASFTQIDVSTGGLDVDGETQLDELVVAGVSTFTAKSVFNTAYPSIDADNEIQVGTAIQLGKAGVITATSFSGDGSALTGIAATDHVSTFDLVVAGISTFNDTAEIRRSATNANPHLRLFAGDSNGSFVIAEATSDHPDLEFKTRAGGSTLSLFKGAAQETVGSNTMDGIGLEDNKSIIFGTGNDAYMRYDPTPGVLDINTVVSEPITLSTNNVERLRIAADGLVSVSGIVSATGITVVAGTGLTAGNTGVITAVAFHGDGSALTGIAATDHVSTFDLVVAGISTFNDDVRILAGGLDVTGVVTATSFSGDGSELTGIVAGQWQKTDVGINTVDKVGIGTTSPDAFLEIHVGTAVTAIDVRGSEGQLFSVTNNLTSGSIFSVNDVSGIPSIDVDADGTIQIAPYGVGELVGIGTASPTSKLDIVGDVQVVGISTFNDRVFVNAGGINVSGISTINDELFVRHSASTFSPHLTLFAENTFGALIASKVGSGYTHIEFRGESGGGGSVNMFYGVTGEYAGSLSMAGIKLEDNRGILFGTDKDAYIRYDPTPGLLDFTSVHTEPIVFSTNETERARITGDGVVAVSGIVTATGINVVAGSGLHAGNTGVVTAVAFHGDGSALTGVGTQGVRVEAESLTVSGISTFTGIATHINTLHGQTLKIAGVSTFSDAVTITKAHGALNVNVLTTNDALSIQNSGSTVGVLAPTSGNRFKVAGRNKHLLLAVNDNGGDTYDIHMNSSSRRILTATPNDGVGVSGIVTATAMNVVAGSGLDAGNTGVVTAVAFHGDGSNLTNIPGIPSEVDTNVSSTSAVGVGSFATASFRSAEVIAQIVQIDEYQVGKYLMIHDGTTVTVIEQAAVATGDSMLGSFDGAINGSNAELRVNMVSSGIATVTTKISTVTI